MLSYDSHEQAWCHRTAAEESSMHRTIRTAALSFLRGCGTGLRLLLMLVFMVGTQIGCATYGVSPELQPYSAITKIPSVRLQLSFQDAMRAMPVDSVACIPETKFAACRTTKGYFIAPLKRGKAVTSDAIFLGETVEQAAGSIEIIRQKIEQQRNVAQEQIAAAMLIGLAAANEASEYDSYSDAPIPPSGIGAVYGAGGANTPDSATPKAAPGASNMYNQQGGYSGFMRPSGSADGMSNIIDGDGNYAGFARPSGEPDGSMNTFDAEGNYSGFTRPSGSADGMRYLFDKDGKYIGSIQNR